MKKIVGLIGLLVLLGAGCAVEPVAPAGVSVGVYGEYPRTYYGRGGYYGRPGYYGRWHHPYDRDRYFYRPYYYRY